MSEANCPASACSADDLSNGLRHAADDHPCCKATMIAAADAIDQMAEALDGLSQPLGRYDYTVAKLDEVVREIAADALIFKQNDQALASEGLPAAPCSRLPEPPEDDV